MPESCFMRDLPKKNVKIGKKLFNEWVTLKHILSKEIDKQDQPKV